MDKFSIRLTQVYQINGRLVIANSLEGAINTWREWMTPNSPDIRKIERVCNEVPIPGDDALVYAEGLCGDVSNQYIGDIARLKEENAKLKYELDKANDCIKDLRDAPIDGTTIPTDAELKSIYAAARVMKQVQQLNDAENLESLIEKLKKAYCDIKPVGV